MKALGFDPSVNDSAWAIVTDDGYVTCGVIRNTSKDRNGWVKCGQMIDQVQEVLGEQELCDIDVWVCEGQYTSYGRNNDHNVRLGWVSAAAYSAGAHTERIIAVPSTWTRGKPKELRHPDLLGKVQSPDKWKWIGDVPPKSLLHNVYDAIGLAVWGMEQQGATVEYIV